MSKRKLSTATTSQVVKCNQCNIVINEVLCFVQNKHDIMDNDSLVLICVTAFSKEDIHGAKSLLFQAIPTDLRNITRKMDGKMQRDMEDIINVFKRTDPEKVPMFVAHDLNKLPPITFDHVDVTRLLRDLLVLRNDVENIKENYVTKEQWVKENCNFPGNSSPNTSHRNNCSQLSVNQPRDLFVNMNRRGGHIRDQNNCCDSEPISIMHIPGSTSFTSQKSADNEIASHCGSKEAQLSLSNTVNTGDVEPCPSRSRAGGIQSAPLARTVAHIETRSQNTEVSSKDDLARFACTQPELSNSTQATLSAVVSINAVGKPSANPNEVEQATGALYSKNYNKCVKNGSFADVMRQKGEWKTVNRRRRIQSKNRIEDSSHGQNHSRFKYRIVGMQGSAKIEPNCKFRAADIKVPLFVYNVDKSASPRDIEEYIEQRTRMQVKVERMEVKAEKNYNAYKILIPNHKLSMFLNDSMWPEGISFRRFIEFNHVNRGDN